MAALVIVLLLFGLAFSLGAAESRLVETLRLRTGVIKRYGGYVLLGVGVWFIALALFAEFFADVFPV